MNLAKKGTSKKLGNGIFLTNIESKEYMNVSIFPVKFIIKVSKKQNVETTSLEDNANQKLAPKEMREKEYLFLSS